VHFIVYCRQLMISKYACSKFGIYHGILQLILYAYTSQPIIGLGAILNKYLPSQLIYIF